VIVIGAGIGGLCASIDLALKGCAVTVIEKGAAVGGKMREVRAGPHAIDAGPTVLTLKSVFEALFERAGDQLARHLTLTSQDILARHAWEHGGELDLFADRQASADAIGGFAGAEAARGYVALSREAANVYRILENTFIHAPKPNLPQLIWRVGPHRLADQWSINPYESFWSAVCRHFKDERLRQMFARYATYCGSSPFSAPATLLLVAHVEQLGVSIVEGGMHALARALQGLAERLGVTFRFGEAVRDVVHDGNGTCGVRLEPDEFVGAAHVVVATDPASIAYSPKAAGVATSLPKRQRSLSAMTLAIAGTASGFSLVRHNVFFPDSSYRDEFRAIFKRGQLPDKPVVYVCAQDRDDNGLRTSHQGPERFLCVINAPTEDDACVLGEGEIERCERMANRLLTRCGLTVQATYPRVLTLPRDLAQIAAGTAGAIYGRASHGWMASFRRQGSRSRIPGLYFAGGSTHPGPGVPMAAISGRLAAEALWSDYALSKTFRPTVMPGGMPMPSATTAVTD
jgi:1-hydroxycarotenoid 3,4-desaturase